MWWSQRAEMLAWGAEREKRMNKSDRKKILCQQRLDALLRAEGLGHIPLINDISLLNPTAKKPQKPAKTDPNFASSLFILEKIYVLKTPS